MVELNYQTQTTAVELKHGQIGIILEGEKEGVIVQGFNGSLIGVGTSDHFTEPAPSLRIGVLPSGASIVVTDND